MLQKKDTKIKNIHIIGGSIFGILLALSLRKVKTFDQVKIIIYEKNNSILTSWQNVSLFNKKVNKGFFGIEIPRSQEFINLFGANFIKKNFDIIPNYKLLLIENDLIPYQYKSSDLPEVYKNQMSLFMDSGIEINNLFKSEKFENLEFFDLIKKCSHRYSDQVEDSIHMFYPWFFPENKFANINNISSQSNTSTKSTYLVPKTGIFSEIVSEVEELLLKNKIELNKNDSLELCHINRKNNENKYFWASSSIPLLKMFKPEAIKKMQINKRYCGISLFELSTKKINNWKRKFKYIPSEILPINSLCPNVSRISFADHLETSQTSYLLIEINSKNEDFLNKIDISFLENWLSEVFNTPVRYKDSMNLFSSYNPSINTYNSLDMELKDLLYELPFDVPFPYWWPINTSRAVSAAISVRDSLVTNI